MTRTTRGGSSAVINQIVEGVRQLRAQSGISISGIGIGVAGQVDPETGAVVFAPNLDWHDVPLGADMEKACAIPVVVTNDVRAALWGEWLFGAGRGRRRSACASLSGRESAEGSFAAAGCLKGAAIRPGRSVI